MTTSKFSLNVKALKIKSKEELIDFLKKSENSITKAINSNGKPLDQKTIKQLKKSKKFLGGIKIS